MFLLSTSVDISLEKQIEMAQYLSFDRSRVVIIAQFRKKRRFFVEIVWFESTLLEILIEFYRKRRIFVEFLIFYPWETDTNHQQSNKYVQIDK